MEKLLIDLGLTENQVKVYLGFLKNDKQLASKMALALGLDKSSTYRAVEELVSKGLLIPTPKKRGTLYEAANPEALKEILNNKKIEISSKSVALDEFIKTFSDKSLQRNTYIKVEKGIEAVRNAMDKDLESAIKSDKLIREKYRLDHPYFSDPEQVKFVNNYVKRRIKNKVRIKQLVHFAGKDVFSSVMKTSSKLLKEIRLMPKDIIDFNAFRIAGDTTHITSFDEKKDYVVITIKDKFVTELMKNLFDFVWNRSELYN